MNAQMIVILGFSGRRARSLRDAACCRRLSLMGDHDIVIRICCRGCGLLLYIDQQLILIA